MTNGPLRQPKQSSALQKRFTTQSPPAEKGTASQQNTVPKGPPKILNGPKTHVEQTNSKPAERPANQPRILNGPTEPRSADGNSTSRSESEDRGATRRESLAGGEAGLRRRDSIKTDGHTSGEKDKELAKLRFQNAQLRTLVEKRSDTRKYLRLWWGLLLN